MWTFLISLQELHVSLYPNKRNVLSPLLQAGGAGEGSTLKRCWGGDNTFPFSEISAIWKCRKCYWQDIWGRRLTESCTEAGCSKSIIGSIITSSPVSSLQSQMQQTIRWRSVRSSLQTLWTILRLTDNTLQLQRTKHCHLRNYCCIFWRNLLYITRR